MMHPSETAIDPGAAVVMICASITEILLRQGTLEPAFSLVRMTHPGNGRTMERQAMNPEFLVCRPSSSGPDSGRGYGTIHPAAAACP
ncbi:hypothetical protein GL297_02110 [Komagataeibacter sp. FXV2]|nr:hypothetical protein [Komagataeibacter sp. FXV2]